MSICLASIADHGRAIVFATDQRLTVAGAAIDRAIVKGNFIGIHWFAMWTAADIGPIPSILRRTKEILQDDGTRPRRWTAQQVSSALSRSYQDETRERAVKEYLSPFGLDMEGFRAQGRDVFGGSHDEKVNQIEQYDLSIHFLVAGFDGIKASIFQVGPRGQIVDWTHFGVAAVGSGEVLSYTAFALGSHTKERSVQQAIFSVLDAKFSAELADGIGPHTTVGVLTSGDRLAFIVKAEVIDSARAAWEKWRASAPPKAMRAIDEWWKPRIDAIEREDAERIKAYAASFVSSVSSSSSDQT